MAKTELTKENVPNLVKGAENLRQHIENLGKFGVPVVVAMNHFVSDTPAEVEALRKKVTEWGATFVVSEGWAKGGEGTRALAERVVAAIDGNSTPKFKFLYEDGLPLWDKMNAIATQIYRADGLEASAAVKKRFQTLQEQGYGHLPICVAKTQYSFSTEANVLGTPRGFTIPVREVRLSAGAGFVVVITGDIMTMPGLPKAPAAEKIDIDTSGRVVGLF
jgi:formate--tetrahydrofolate ligase